jgi:hypothetical protein
MTTHDYPGETNAPAEVDATAAVADPRSERLVESPTADMSEPPQTSADPAWQRQADQFAADRVHHGEPHSSATEVDPTTSVGGDVQNDSSRIDDQPSSETSLFASTDLEQFRGQWNTVQAGFVDDPRSCVEQADGLVSAVVEQLSNGFAEARSRLEQQWSRGEDASTEDLRVALKRYREFFDRLLAV